MLSKFLDYLNAQVDVGVYVWGGQGEKVSTVGGDSKVKDWMYRMYRSQSSSQSANNKNADKAYKRYQQMVKKYGVDRIVFYDCSGLGMYFFQNITGLASSDTTAAGMQRKCKPLSKSDLKPGDFVFKASSGKVNHVGYVVQGGYVIEARASGDGVIKRKLSAGGWTLYGRHPWLADYIEQNDIENPVLRRGSAGVAVKRMQKLLLSKGLKLPLHGADAEFGKETEVAVKAFQKAQKLKEDGVVGEKTWGALLAETDKPVENKTLTVTGLSAAQGAMLLKELIAAGYQAKLD